jgi:hypothetical protein
MTLVQDSWPKSATYRVRSVYEGLGSRETVTQVSLTQIDNVQSNELTREYFPQYFSQALDGSNQA